MGIQIGDVIYDPYPLTEEKDFEILQKDGKRNVVRLTADSIHILTANCANQDCIRQGLVSLANRDQRVLQNQIICLPNKVLLTLLTPQEAQTQWANLYAAGYSK